MARGAGDRNRQLEGLIRPTGLIEMWMTRFGAPMHEIDTPVTRSGALEHEIEMPMTCSGAPMHEIDTDRKSVV